jgi:hypothetical protein
MLDPEMLRKLKELGIDPGPEGQWVQTRPFNAAELPSIKRQRELLAKLRDVLKAQLEQDLTKLDQAREEYERLKNGGGT